MDEYDYPNQFYYEDYEINEETFYQTYKYCVEPTIHEIIPYIWKMTLCNLVFRIVICLPFITKGFGHALSMLIGTSLLYFLMRNSLLYIVIFILFCYVTLMIFYWMCSSIYVYIVSFVYVVYLIGSELYFPIPSMWMEARGLHMVISMKFISLMFDVQNKTVKQMPNIVEIGGYILCPSNCLLGPWVSYKSYSNLFTGNTRILDVSWVKYFILFATTSLLFLISSNCSATYLISQDFKWTVAYQEAFSFRFSHYFVSFMSSAMLSITGSGYDENKKSSVLQSYYITNPFHIELPRSLVQVVVYWNMPMHLWLKKYVFRVSKPLGNFTALILTYLVSSFLHGFNLKLAAVLLSLGFYTYVEYEFRNKLSFIFDACVKANPCKKCNHKYQNHFGLAIFHLSYLGCLMENLAVNSENDENILEKWAELGYSSHIVTASIYFFHKLI